jgi:putative effector of murein hydrolase LrgA (UPF0299 family)
MIEARRCHRQLRAKQRGAVALRRGSECLQAIAACVSRAPAGSALRKALVTVAQVVALIAVNQLAFRIVFMLTLPGPAGVAGIIVLLGFVSSRLAPARWVDKGASLLRLYGAPVAILIALGIAARGDPFVSQELAIALTLLASATAAGFAVVGRMHRNLRSPAPRPRMLAATPAGYAGLTFT